MNKSRLSNIFPNIGALAYYDQFHQIIKINKYDFEDFKNIKLNVVHEESIDKIALFEHELTHWIDHCSTLWGQRNIVLLFNALNAYANQNIEEFWRIKTLDNAYRKDTFFDYFSEQYNMIQGNEKSKWRYSISSGLRFDEFGKPSEKKPILFVRFNANDDTPISRVPLTVASILETNAIKAEYGVKFSAIKNEKDKVKQASREEELKNQLIRLIYHPQLTLYSVIAHLTANLNNEEDIVNTLHQTSSIGTLVLNLPDKAFKMLKIPFIHDETWDKRFSAFKANKDVGATYYFLLKNLIDKKDQNPFSEDAILSASNLPIKEEITALVIEEMQANTKQLIQGPFTSMALEILDNGIEMFTKRGLFGTNKGFRDYVIKNKLKPTVLFRDTSLKTKKLTINNIIKKLNNNELLTVHEKYFYMNYYDEKIQQFNEICGI